MNEKSDTLPPAGWADWVMFGLAIAMLVFVVAMWTTSYPIDLGA